MVTHCRNPPPYRLGLKPMICIIVHLTLKMVDEPIRASRHHNLILFGMGVIVVNMTEYHGLIAHHVPLWLHNCKSRGRSDKAQPWNFPWWALLSSPRKRPSLKTWTLGFKLCPRRSSLVWPSGKADDQHGGNWFIMILKWMCDLKCTYPTRIKKAL